MLDLSYLYEKHQIADLQILHVGAHKGEERQSYSDLSALKVVWIEANPTLAAALAEKIFQSKDFKFETVINTAVSNSDNDSVVFNIANNGQSSSLLEMGLHRDWYPSIEFTSQIRISSTRGDTLLNQHKELAEGLNYLHLDIQGAELEALKSFGSRLSQFKWIYCEVNRVELYKGCGLIWDIDDYLLKQGFHRTDCIFTKEKWGDAFYVRKDHVTPAEMTLRRLSNEFDKRKWQALDCVLMNGLKRLYKLFKRTIGRIKRAVRKPID